LCRQIGGPFRPLSFSGFCLPKVDFRPSLINFSWLEEAPVSDFFCRRQGFTSARIFLPLARLAPGSCFRPGVRDVRGLWFSLASVSASARGQGFLLPLSFSISSFERLGFSSVASAKARRFFPAISCACRSSAPARPSIARSRSDFSSVCFLTLSPDLIRHQAGFIFFLPYLGSRAHSRIPPTWISFSRHSCAQDLRFGSLIFLCTSSWFSCFPSPAHSVSSDFSSLLRSARLIRAVFSLCANSGPA
jgi:hypothetical protein